MKRVLLCVPSLAVGGAERFAVTLARMLRADGRDVAVAETRNRVESHLRTALKEAGIEIVDLTGASYLTMLKKQLRYLRHARPDVVHANTGSVLHLMLACMLCRVPTRIYTVHNEAKLLYGGSGLKKQIYRLAFTLFRFVPVAICPTVRETLVRDMGLSPERVPVVNNGVDTQRFTPPEQAEAHSDVRLITVATLYGIKNQEMTICAVRALRDTGLPVTLTLVGDGVDRPRLERLVRELGLEDAVFLPGSRTDVERCLHDADVYVSASRTEGLPLSILEAMACALPVVATDVGGTRDIVRNGENGVLIPQGDQDAMCDAIRLLAEDAPLRAKFGARSREIAGQWSLRACTDGYCALYEG